VALALGQQQVRNSRELFQGHLPFLGTYWESYLKYQTLPKYCLNLSAGPRHNEDDFGHDLTDVPLEVNVVHIAFAHSGSQACFIDAELNACEPYICGMFLYGIAGNHEKDFEELKKDIVTLQNRGQLVTLAFGGESYGNPHGITDRVSADSLVKEMVYAVNTLGLDGVEIVNTDGCGPMGFQYGDKQCDAEATQQLHIVEK